MAPAGSAGEHITSLGGHPSLRIGPLLETHKHNFDEILREARAERRFATWSGDARRRPDIIGLTMSECRNGRGTFVF